MSTRFGFPWGLGQPREVAPQRRWNEVKVWNKMSAFKAIADRVFCGSMCDVFEARADLIEPRARLFRLIAETPALVWMLLTKRIGNVPALVPWKPGQWPANIWLGATVENSTMAAQRIPALLKAGCKTTFVSGEPLLEMVDWETYLKGPGNKMLILGAESGHGARHCDNAWILHGVQQAEEFGVPVFVKQLQIEGQLVKEMEQFPPELRVRQLLEMFTPERAP